MEVTEVAGTQVSVKAADAFNSGWRILRSLGGLFLARTSKGDVELEQRYHGKEDWGGGSVPLWRPADSVVSRENLPPELMDEDVIQEILVLTTDVPPEEFRQLQEWSRVISS